MMKFISACVLSAMCAWPVFGAERQRFVSGPAQVSMIELFTSEGCSSCPPAEAYLNGLQNEPGLWTKYIPLAFHVDYWNYLGWKDRFSDAAYSARQRQYARERLMLTVYTPAFFVNGEPWRPQRHPDIPLSDTRVGKLTVDVIGTQYRAVFELAESNSKALQLNVALLGMGLTTNIRAGENAGRQAQHDFVVLSWQRFESDDGRWRGALPAPALARDTSRLALVAWVSKLDNPTPLQAVGGYLAR